MSKKEIGRQSFYASVDRVATICGILLFGIYIVAFILQAFGIFILGSPLKLDSGDVFAILMAICAGLIGIAHSHNGNEKQAEQPPQTPEQIAQ